MISGLKHYTTYTVEDNRGSRSFNISMFDFWDTYLPAYEKAFVEGNAMAVMTSYASENGIPSCANEYNINYLIRKKWNRENVIAATDCGAISNMVTANHYAKDPEDAASKALNAGTDLSTDDNWRPKSSGGNDYLENAIKKNLTSETKVN